MTNADTNTKRRTDDETTERAAEDTQEPTRPLRPDDARCEIGGCREQPIVRVEHPQRGLLPTCKYHTRQVLQIPPWRFSERRFQGGERR